MNWKNMLDQKQLKDNAPLIIGGLVVGLLVIWVAFRLLSPALIYVCRVAIGEQDETEQKRSRTVSVEATAVKMGSISKRIPTVGKLRANNSVIIKSEAPGKIKEIVFTEGTEVKKDDVLIRFEDADTQAELAQADAELAHRDSDFKRIKQLQSQNIASVKARDEAEAMLKMAKAKVDAAKVRLEKTVIKAPFEGTIGLMDVSPGAYIQTGQDLVALVDNIPIKVEFKIPEKNLHDVGVGQAAEVRLNGFPDEIFHATVEAIDSKIDSQSHSISVRAMIPNENGRLRAGLFANVSLVIGDRGDAIVVPETALEREGEIEYVWVVLKGKARQVQVMTGTRENGIVEIISGIPEGALVITSGQIKVGPGTPVTITNMPEGTSKEGEKTPTPEKADAKQEAPKTAGKVALTAPKEPEKKDEPSTTKQTADAASK